MNVSQRFSFTLSFHVRSCVFVSCSFLLYASVRVASVFAKKNSVFVYETYMIGKEKFSEPFFVFYRTVCPGVLQSEFLSDREEFY